MFSHKSVTMQDRKILIVTTLILFLSLQLKAQDTKLMASYIYSFTQYMEWPMEYQDGDFIIGIYGKSDITNDLEKLVADRKINNQPVVIKKFTSLEEITRCHVVLVSVKSDNDISSIIEKFKPYNTLIITEKSGITKNGPGISLITKDGKLSFELNKVNIKNKGLNIDNEFCNYSGR